MTAEVLVPVRSGRGRSKNAVLAAVCIVLFATMLDTTIASVALSDLYLHANLSVPTLQWVLNGYLVMFAACMLAGGSLADRYGRRRLMLIGLGVFAFGSFLCVQGTSSLVSGRLLQGVGAALSEPATLAVVRHTFDDTKERARALGIWAATSGIALAAGPVVGGILVAIGGWKAVFVFNIPLAIVCGIVGYLFVPESSDPQATRPDVVGLGFSAAAVLGLSYAFIESERKGFGHGSVLFALVLMAAGVVGFIMWQRLSPEPAIPRGLLADHRVRGGLLGTLVPSFATYAIFFLATLDLGVVASRSPGHIAGTFVPMTVAMIATAVAGGNWTAIQGPTLPLLTGLVTSAVGIGLTVPVLGVDPDSWLLAATLMIVGAGLGLCLAPAAAAVLQGVSADRAGLGAAVVNEGRMLGGLLAVAILGNVATGRLQSGIADRLCHPATLLCSYKDSVLDGVLTGQGGTDNEQLRALAKLPGIGTFISTAVNAAYSAFSSALRASLLLVVVLLVLTLVAVAVPARRGLFAGISLPGRPAAATPVPVGPGAAAAVPPAPAFSPEAEDVWASESGFGDQWSPPAAAAPPRAATPPAAPPHAAPTPAAPPPATAPPPDTAASEAERFWHEGF